MSTHTIEAYYDGIFWLVAPDGFKIGITFNQYRAFYGIGHISFINKVRQDNTKTVALFNAPYYNRLDVWDLNQKHLITTILDSEPSWDLDGKDTVVS
jgi:hypothetical protein